MAPRTLVVLNPRSRGGASRRRVAALEASLREALGPLDFETTRGPRDAERLAREGVRSGIERLVVAGGDGTLSEVVTGLMAAKLADYVTLGLIPLGTGSDFAKTLGVPRDPEEAVAVIARGATRRVDAGRARFEGPDGGERVAYYANAASFGISGRVTELANRSAKRLGGTATFAWSAIRAIVRHRPVPVTVRVDSETFAEGGLVLGAAANGHTFGGGMRVAPEARPDDGLLDVVAVTGLGAARLLQKLPRLYRGTHLDDAAVAFRRGRIVEAAPVGDDAVPLELDGEPLGRLPARFEVVPGALSMYAPNPS